MWSDGVVTPHPPIIRALQHVAECCRKAGMTVVSWAPLQHDRAWDLYLPLLNFDGGKGVLKPLEDADDPVLPLIRWIVDQHPKCLTEEEYAEALAARDSYRSDYAAHWDLTASDDGQEVDVILCPTGPGVAPQHDTAKYWTYTCIWNLCDYPAAAFPTSLFVDQELDVKDEGYVPINEQDAYNHGLYAPEHFVGAPIGLQLVGRRGKDEHVLACLEHIERAMGSS